jgi:hypothetical protein
LTLGGLEGESPLSATSDWIRYRAAGPKMLDFCDSVGLSISLDDAN